MRTLVAAIVGPKQAKAEAKAPEKTRGQTASATSSSKRELLALSGVVNDRLRGVDLSLMDGEIHGLAGLIGSGRTEILETIFALRPIEGGELRLDGALQHLRGPAEAIEKGVALVPEDRQAQGLVLDHSIERNFSLPRLPHFSWASWVRRGAETQETEAAINACRSRRLALRPAFAIFPEATNKRWSSPNGTMNAPASCCSTSRLSASTSARARKSMVSSGMRRGAALAFSSSRLTSRADPAMRPDFGDR